MDVSMGLQIKQCPTCGSTILEPKSAEQYQEWYNLYPRKQGKKEGLRAFLKVRIGFDELMEKTQQYANSKSDTEKRYIPLPASFPNGERWEDEILEEEDQDLKGLCVL